MVLNSAPLIRALPISDFVVLAKIVEAAKLAVRCHKGHWLGFGRQGTTTVCDKCGAAMVLIGCHFFDIGQRP